MIREEEEISEAAEIFRAGELSEVVVTSTVKVRANFQAKEACLEVAISRLEEKQVLEVAEETSEVAEEGSEVARIEAKSKTFIRLGPPNERTRSRSETSKERRPSSTTMTEARSRNLSLRSDLKLRSELLSLQKLRACIPRGRPGKISKKEFRLFRAKKLCSMMMIKQKIKSSSVFNNLFCLFLL